MKCNGKSEINVIGFMKPLFYIAFLLSISGCSRDPFSPTSQASAEIRILNSSPWTFTECTVDPTGKFSGDPAFNYGNLAVGTYSDYHLFKNIYRYSWVKLTMNNKNYSLNPIDFVGETPLNNGKYTYKLSYLSNEDRLYLELIQ